MQPTRLLSPRGATLVIGVCVWFSLNNAAALAQRDLKEIPIPDPELERATFVLPDGFEVNLYAADPAIAKPIQMNFDPQGRLWIASSEVYPHIKPGEEATDRVVVVEDRDGDGVGDQTHIFAEGLLIPTGVAPGDGGAYVGASTELIHFRDIDGDLRADEKRIVLSGFGTEDTHHILHTLRWGPEQLLYFSQSIYIHSHIETPWGVKRLNAGGIWQFRPENLKLDVFARGLVNTWGTDFDIYGATFATDGAGGEGINYMVPGASYVTAYGAPRILQGLNPGSPKHCGLEIVDGRHLPEDWQGSFVTNDFRGHRVCRFVLTEVGSGYVSQEQQEVIKSDHPAFRPIDVKMGPDGAIYIADWYNPIIQHGEVDFRDPRRDHTHGRIWRVSRKDVPLVPRPKLVDATTRELLDQLDSPEGFTRMQAKRVLKERGREILSELDAWTAAIGDETANDRLRLEALWMYQALDEPRPELLAMLLTCQTPNVRAAAVRVIGHWQSSLPEALDWLAAGVQDDHSRVRLEAVRVLGRISDPRGVAIALAALDHEMDEWLDYSLWLTVRELQPVWQPVLAAGKLEIPSARRLAFLLRSAGSPEAVPPLVALLKEGAVAEAELPTALDVIAEFGRPEDLQAVFDLATAAPDQPALQTIVLQSLLQAQTRRNVRPANAQAGLAQLIGVAHPRVRGLAARCAGAWQAGDAWPLVRDLDVGDDRQLAEDRLAAISSYGGEEAVQLLANLADDAEIFAPAIVGLLPHQPQSAAQKSLTWMQTGDEQPAAGSLDASLSRVFGAFLQRKEGPGLLVAALRDQTIRPDAAVVGLRAISATGQPHADLAAALTRAGNITSGPRVLSADEMAAIVETVRTSGDAARGEAIFRRSDLTCFKCHAIGDAGGLVGPNLVSLGATAQVDYLVDSILNPTKNIKENYHTAVVATDEGKVISGIKVRQSDTDLILRDAEDREIAVPLASIDEQSTGASLMPAGLADKLTRGELVDLVAFLSALGREPAYIVGQTPLARRWEVLQPTPQAAHQLRRVSFAAAAEEHPAFQWQAAYATVAGELPLGETPAVSVPGRGGGNRGVTFLRVQVDAAAAGICKLELNSPEGVSAWWDGQPIESDSPALTVSAGDHQLTLAVDRSVRNDAIRATLIPEGAARARFVGGK